MRWRNHPAHVGRLERLSSFYPTNCHVLNVRDAHCSLSADNLVFVDKLWGGAKMGKHFVVKQEYCTVRLLHATLEKADVQSKKKT